MSDDRRFEATASRRRRALREGNAPRSAEASSLVAFATATGTATCAVPAAALAAAAMLRAAFAAPDVPHASLPACTALLGAALSPALAAAAGGTVACIAQTGGVSVAALRFEPKRLDPFAGLRRMIGADALVAAARAACAFAAALGALLPLAGDVLGSAGAVATPAQFAAFAGSAALRACLAAVAAGAVFALADVVLARRRWLRGLRMTFEELKRDAKEHDGDPSARARRKSAHRTIARSGIARVREASFVVANPTHVAVALRYAPPAIAVPEIVVRAADDAALRVRVLAARHGVPVIEDVPLARLLYALGEAGRPIPLESYVAVAHVVAALAREGLLA